MSKTVDVVAGIGLDQKTRKSRWPARLDVVQSASGLFLGLFMWGHMVFVSTSSSARTPCGGSRGCSRGSLFSAHDIQVSSDVCPKNLPLSTQIAFLRRKMAAAGWK